MSGLDGGLRTPSASILVINVFKKLVKLPYLLRLPVHVNIVAEVVNADAHDAEV